MIRDFRDLEIQWKRLEQDIPANFQGVMVSMSGGLDSTALFHLLWDFAKSKKNFSLSVFHTNFGLRESEADLDQRFSEDLARRAGVPIYVRQVPDSERRSRAGESLQEWARRLRYQALEEYAAAGWVIALGHHQDDLAENVLFRLSRGSSVGRMGGMEPWMPPFWRPLLHVSKAQLAYELSRRGEGHRHDSSNDMMMYSRNIIRRRILPELESLHPGASTRIADAAREALDLALWTRRRVLEELDTEPLERLRILRAYPEGVAFEALTALINQESPEETGSPRSFHREGLREILKAVNADYESGSGGFARDLPGGGRIVIDRSGLRIEPEPKSGGARARGRRRQLRPKPPETFLEQGSHALFRIGKQSCRVEPVAGPRSK